MFCCVLNLDGERVSPEVRARYAGRMRTLVEGDAVEEVDAGAFVAWVVPARVPLRPLWARRGGRVAVGNVRLDHPEEVRRWGGTREPNASSLELVMDAYQARGEKSLGEMLGDFSVVIYDPAACTLVAARDAFGVRTLFVGETDHTITLGSHLESINEGEQLDEEFVGDFLLGGDPGPERTVWRGLRAVAQGSMLRTTRTKVFRSRFWAPHDFRPACKLHGHDRERDDVAAFGALFRNAVQASIRGADGLWSDLSGGLDSSSVVCMASRLHEEVGMPKLLGTATIVDHLGTGDERAFSDLVVNTTRVHNVTFPNLWPWFDDGEAPPCTDEPRTHYPFFARDRHYCRALHASGARVLLSGMGSDHYLYGNRGFFADLVDHGTPLAALGEVVRWAIAERRSVWAGVFQDLVLPYAGRGMRKRFAPIRRRTPAWITPGFASRHSLADRLNVSRASAAVPGNRFGHQVANDLQELTRWLQRGPYEIGLEMRYPFLYRPLVEFSLRLPAAMRSRPLAPKWVLRESMRGVLPEPIRTRPGKGGIEARVLWALAAERSRISDILKHSLLGDLGIIKPQTVGDAVRRAASGEAPNVVMLLSVLALDTWLYVRAGRWRSGQSQPSEPSLISGLQSPLMRR